MAKPRLKVYRAQMGFSEAIVAAPNQKAALTAWGARQDLFGEGLAGLCDDPGAVEAATARPGDVLQRAVGSSGAWGDTAAPPAVPAAKRRAASRSSSPQPKAAPAPKPDRGRLTAAEKVLAEVEAEELDVLTDLAGRRTALDHEEADARRTGERKRHAAQRELDAAERAFRQASGEAE